MRDRPASASLRAERSSVTPLVVSEISGAGRRATSRPTITSRSGCTSGSPPVSRMLVIPRSTNSAARRTNSSSVSRWAFVNQSSPSAGMQYVHRSEHRSVSETRRSVATRPNPSTSGPGPADVGSVITRSTLRVR